MLCNILFYGQEYMYNQRGEQQLREYLDGYHVEKGYLLTLIKNKKTGIRKLECQGKQLLEVVV